MAVYRRGKIWWYRFEFGGRRIQESSHCQNKHKAEQMEAKRKTDLAEGHAGIRRKEPPPRFEEAVHKFLEWSKYQHRPKTHELFKLHCETLKRIFAGENGWTKSLPRPSSSLGLCGLARSVGMRRTAVQFPRQQ